MAFQQGVPSFEELPQRGQRRGSVRQKPHTPTYATFDRISGGTVLDLTEVLNLSETGVCIHTTAPVAPNRTLNLVLDLSDTKAYINTSGLVVWTDRFGRAGVRFSKLSETNRRQLKEWLFVNLLNAVYKSAHDDDDAEADPIILEALQQDEPAVEEVDPADLLLMEIEEGEVEQPNAMVEEKHELQSARALTFEPPQLAVDAPTLNAIQRQIAALGSDLDAALAILVQRAQTITRASGAAIALEQGSEMVCRASSGEAPPLGARLQVGSGVSGECVRTAKVQRCDDSETHPLVDRESCRALGIRSMIAAPVVCSERVIGLLEVFSPNAGAFEETDAIGLRRLADVIAKAASSVVIDAGQVVILPETSPQRRRSPLLTLASNNLVLLTVASLLVLLILGTLLTWLVRRPARVGVSQSAQVQRQQGPLIGTLEDLRKYAAQGDPVAQYALGARYAQGIDVKQDQAEAVRWFTRAAEQGHVGAQAALGVYYWAGRGVPADLSKAYFWSLLARAGGDEGSKYRVASLASRMSHTQVLEAQRQADEWLRQHQNEASAAH
ncbi:MAG TPA: GAF domain-containing protein [Terriglobales bacterium]|nr:GAF domain-containing protein [Terriglobales bacterium]